MYNVKPASTTNWLVITFGICSVIVNVLSVSSEDHTTSEHDEHQTHSSQQLVNQYPSMTTGHPQLPTFGSQVYPTPFQQLQYQQAYHMIYPQQGMLPYAPSYPVSSPLLVQQQQQQQQLQAPLQLQAPQQLQASQQLQAPQQQQQQFNQGKITKCINCGDSIAIEIQWYRLLVLPGPIHSYITAYAAIGKIYVEGKQVLVWKACQPKEVWKDAPRPGFF